MKKKTDMVLAQLKRAPKKGVTSLEAFDKWKVTRLSSIIYNLKKRGYDITTEIRYEKGVGYAVYRLNK
jgi:hypothetical protein